MPDSKLKEKEREAQLKALRRELASEMEESLAQAQFPQPEPPPEAAKDLSPKRILEALLFSTGKPLTVPEIRKIIQGAPAKEVEGWIAELRAEYEREGRSFELIEIAGGWEIATKKAYAAWLAKLELQKRLRQASRSALETLAILAYKQPVTRAEIEDLRGVDISGVLLTLLEKGFVRIAGKKEVPGRPFLYATSEKFLEHFGLKSIQELPPIGEIKGLIERVVKKEELEANEPQGPAPQN